MFKDVSQRDGITLDRTSYQDSSHYSNALVKEAGLELRDAPQEEEIPKITELDELQTFVGNKRDKIWVWTAVNH